MRDFDSIDLSTLSTVTGGANNNNGPANSDKMQAGVQATIPKVGPVNVGLNAERNRSDYGYCVNTVSGMKGATPADIGKTCGLPPGGNQ